jgi:hypothetical protein
MASQGIDQESGNYNVFCQSCGRVIAINIDNHNDALDSEKEHLDNTDCIYTGTHKIQESP